MKLTHKPVEIAQEFVAEARDQFDVGEARKQLKESAARLYPDYVYVGSRMVTTGGKLNQFVCTFEHSRWKALRNRWISAAQSWFGRPAPQDQQQ